MQLSLTGFQHYFIKFYYSIVLIYVYNKEALTPRAIILQPQVYHSSQNNSVSANAYRNRQMYALDAYPN